MRPVCTFGASPTSSDELLGSPVHTLRMYEPCMASVQGYHGTIMAYGQVKSVWLQGFLWPELLRPPPLACCRAGMLPGCLMDSGPGACPDTDCPVCTGLSNLHL